MDELNKKKIRKLIKSHSKKPTFILVYEENCELSLDYFDNFMDYSKKYTDSRFFYVNITDIKDIDEFEGICCTPACYIFYGKKRYVEYYISDEIITLIINHLKKIDK